MPSLRVRNVLLADASGDEGQYTGELQDDLPHGRGEMVYPDYRKYSGDFSMGRWHGFGTATFPNGDIYRGEYRLDQRHGEGEYRWQDGRLYKGQFFNDVRHGKGLYRWKDGATYQGEFWEGARQGHGEYNFEGGIYTGQFKQGQYHGYGECEWKDGRMYKGEWKEGMAHGKGMVVDRYGKILHQGDWRNDEPVGGAIATGGRGARQSQQFELYGSVTPVVNEAMADSKGRKGIFRGTVHQGTPHGVGLMAYGKQVPVIETYQGFWEMGEWKEGRLEYRNSDFYHGEFMHDKRDGFGEYHWIDSTQYHGEWKEDQRHGHGKFMYPNGDVFEGQFINGVREGPGRFDFADGQLFEGRFGEGGMFHGNDCKYVHRDGRVYIGDFRKGLRNGQGRELYPNGQLRYEGEWINDLPRFPRDIKAAPPGFILQDETEPDATESPASTIPTGMPSVLAMTANCRTVVEEIVKDALGNSGTFTGLVSPENLPHGVGRMVYSREIRDGFWFNGFLEGHARAFFTNGDFYEGNFSKSQREGKGIYKWKDGRIFEGEYKDDLRHGLGRFDYPCGDEYVGHYERGQRCGPGKFSFVDGSSYDGEWFNSQYHGFGIRKEIDGSSYEGHWIEGKRHGKGVSYSRSMGTRLNGVWEADQLVHEIIEPSTAPKARSRQQQQKPVPARVDVTPPATTPVPAAAVPASVPVPTTSKDGNAQSDNGNTVETKANGLGAVEEVNKQQTPVAVNSEIEQPVNNDVEESGPKEEDNGNISVEELRVKMIQNVGLLRQDSQAKPKASTVAKKLAVSAPLTNEMITEEYTSEPSTKESAVVKGQPIISNNAITEVEGDDEEEEEEEEEVGITTGGKKKKKKRKKKKTRAVSDDDDEQYR
eukprot:CAMPEP_0202451392 /NCGR_PEP_ID=MMETSP1360-20130828/9840_1 /ASSEMBLY_ACC=CAM_ASM_000848 /TAXON_ID=515479 /ORGANISM="Licmophora paradoxa, Strain CCMP2313" /LENGTH=873 /DNA_ID=CAMNT_0049069961 /DNA_START=48 /DNA_END=2669 /DNA_ORIENTATION=+